MSAWSHPILFCLLNSASTYFGILGGGSGRCLLRKRGIPCIRAGIRVVSALFLITHLNSVFLSFSHVPSPFLYWDVWEVSSFAWPQFMMQAVVDHEPHLCITSPVGNSSAANCVAHIERSNKLTSNEQNEAIKLSHRSLKPSKTSTPIYQLLNNLPYKAPPDIFNLLSTPTSYPVKIDPSRVIDASSI